MRINLTLLDPTALNGDFPEAARAVVMEGRALGQVRIWGNEPSVAADVRRTVARQMTNAGVDSLALDRTVVEPTYRPPSAARITLDALPADDLQVAKMLLALLARLPVTGAQQRSARQVGSHSARVRRGNGSIVSFHYETHRAGTGALHMRRREVEAGLERPGLVRTFNVAGLRGAARLRIRDVGGRVSAEFAGTQHTVQTIRQTLSRAMGGRA